MEYNFLKEEDTSSTSSKLIHSDEYDPERSINTLPYSRTLTFTRALTFSDTSAMKRNLSLTFGFDIDSDEAWTKNLLETYYLAANTGVEGDIPIPADFARNYEFWKAFIVATLNGAFIGLVALGFLNFSDRIPRIWANNWSTGNDDDFFSCGAGCFQIKGCSCDKYLNTGFYSGHPYWIAVTTLTGFVIGLIRYSIDYPDNLPGLFKEIIDFHVEPKWSAPTVLLSAISLAGGASLGPEQAMSNLGGGIATYLIENYVHFEDEDYAKLLVLAGMASALGALFPTPFLAVLMLHELGEPPKSYMESTLIMSAGACTAFVVYYALVDMTFIESTSSNGAVLSFQWKFEEWNCGTAILIGMICAPLGILIFLFVGITKQILNRIRFRLHRNKLLASIVPPILSGLCIGTVNWALPITLGNGNMIISSIISYGNQGLLANDLLIYSALAKMFLLGMSMNGGFVGGFIFPIFTISVIAAVICHQVYPAIPLGLALGCFLSGLPASICPMPFTLSALPIFVYYFGLYQTAPVFLSSIVSYTIVCGSGLFGSLVKRGQEQQRKANEALEKEKEGGAHGNGHNSGIHGHVKREDDSSSMFKYEQYAKKGSR